MITYIPIRESVTQDAESMYFKVLKPFIDQVEVKHSSEFPVLAMVYQNRVVFLDSVLFPASEFNELGVPTRNWSDDDVLLEIMVSSEYKRSDRCHKSYLKLCSNRLEAKGRRGQLKERYIRAALDRPAAMASAVRKARELLQGFSWVHRAAVAKKRSNAEWNHSEWREEPKERLFSLQNAFSVGDLLRTLIHMQAQGAVITDDRVKTLVDEGSALIAEMERRTTGDVYLEAVIRRLPDGSTMINGWGARAGFGDGAWRVSKGAEVPEPFATPLFLLGMAQPMTFIPEVGIKVDDTTFRVLVKEQDYAEYKRQSSP